MTNAVPQPPIAHRSRSGYHWLCKLDTQGRPYAPRLFHWSAADERWSPSGDIQAPHVGKWTDLTGFHYYSPDSGPTPPDVAEYLQTIVGRIEERHPPTQYGQTHKLTSVEWDFLRNQLRRLY